MATGDNDSTVLPFVEQAKYWFEKMYPKWKETFTGWLLAENTETICIPDALDILPNRRLETHHNLAAEDKSIYRRDIVGQTGEDKFFQAFRRLKLGGILISGFDTQEFIMKMNSDEISGFSYGEWKEQKRHFECDAIFIHQQFGAFIIETKACDNGKVNKRHNKATAQLDKRIQGMKDVYRKITDTDCPIDFRGVICMPNVDVNQAQYVHRVLGKSEIENSEQFREFWHPTPINELQQSKFFEQRSQESVSDHLLTYVAAIIGYRSVKFISLPSNALEIHRIIEQQEFAKKGRKKNQETASSNQDEARRYPPIKAELLMLSEEQLHAVECDKQHIIISGPPGTGKTTIMLLRALAAAKLDKPGRVLLVTNRSQYLTEIFEKFVADNKSNSIKREIIVTVIDSRPIVNKYRHDDIFCDEFGQWSDKLCGIYDRSLDSTVTGTTTIVITGYYDIQKVTDITTETLDHCPSFHHIGLKFVIRGTVSIVQEWQRFFGNRLLLGHNVKGAPVERIEVDSTDQLCVTVEQKVSELCGTGTATTDSGDNYCFSPQHLAIVALDVYAINALKLYLTSKGIAYGKIFEQVQNSNLIALGIPAQTVSFDWPVVITVSTQHNFDQTDNGQRAALIAMSRCIAKLIIVQASPSLIIQKRSPKRSENNATWFGKFFNWISQNNPL